MRALLTLTAALLASSAAADPLTLTVVQTPLLKSTEAYYTLFADVDTRLPAPTNLVITAPDGTHTYAFPVDVDGVTIGFTVPRVYTPTPFHVTADLGARHAETTVIANSPVPEPATGVLLGVGLLIAGWRLRKRPTAQDVQRGTGQ